MDNFKFNEFLVRSQASVDKSKLSGYVDAISFLRHSNTDLDGASPNNHNKAHSVIPTQHQTQNKNVKHSENPNWKRTTTGDRLFNGNCFQSGRYRSVGILNDLRPGSRYELSTTNENERVGVGHRMNSHAKVIVDGNVFHGFGRCKRAAKERAAALALSEILGLQSQQLSSSDWDRVSLKLSYSHYLKV